MASSAGTEKTLTFKYELINSWVSKEVLKKCWIDKKIKGLKRFYGVNSKEGLEFFEAHKSADVIHRAECEKLLDSLSKEEQEKAETASLLTARYLWNFLSGMTSKHKLQNIAA